MMSPRSISKIALALMMVLPFVKPAATRADPSRYPQFAQQHLPKDVSPSFISVDELAAELKKGTKPVIIDVRSTEEFNQAHIRGARSAPLENFRDHVKTISRDRLTILY
jgi:hypothetical protein